MEVPEGKKRVIHTYCNVGKSKKIFSSIPEPRVGFPMIQNWAVRYENHKILFKGIRCFIPTVFAESLET